MPCFHPTQILYLLLFSFPNIWIEAENFVRNVKLTFNRIKNSLTVFVMFVIMTIIFLYLVHHYTIIHRFILADNRHYIFYIWSKFFGKYIILRYLLCPLYAFIMLFLILLVVNNHFKFIMLGMWLLCTLAVLIPAKLVEFRYFTVPLIMLNLMIHPFKPIKENKTGFILSLTCYLIINGVLFYVFLYRTFQDKNGEL